jgi:hypothetical protein
VALFVSLVTWSGINFLLDYFAFTASGLVRLAVLAILFFLALVVVMTALLWLFFPVFVYFSLQRMENLLRQIEARLASR